MLAYRSVFYSVYDLMSLLNHLEQLKQDRLLQYEKTVVKLGMRRLNSEGKKTILGADMETQTPFLELEMAPKQTRPTNQEAHYLQSRCMLNRPNKNYHRSEKIFSLHPPETVSKIVSFLQDKNYRALPHAYPTKYAQERKESSVTSSTVKCPIRLNVVS